MTELQKELFQLQDEGYRDFHASLMPTVPKKTIIGIRVPVLRSFAKQFFKTEQKNQFLKELPHTYYEENNLHAFMIEQIKDFEEALSETENFLPYIDNWATCDMFFPKVFLKNSERLLPKIRCWITSEHPYTVRYAIGLLMRMFLEEEFLPEYPEMVLRVESEEYYVKMMIAWYFATALAKQYQDIISYFTKPRLDVWTHNKAIQKAIESNRIPEETKKYLKTLKRKT
ncbi:MAG: DNA alkylation repair protein [Ruminococcaceae bacterium]|nr:DNA alkylation repair protein [Oscillospiraceae bacterium]